MRQIRQATAYKYRDQGGCAKYIFVALLVMLVGILIEILPVIAECRSSKIEYCLLDGLVSISAPYTFCFAIAMPYLALQLYGLFFDSKQQHFIRARSRKTLWDTEAKTSVICSLAWVLFAFAITVLAVITLTGSINNWWSESGFLFSMTGLVLDISPFIVIFLFLIGAWIMLLIVSALVQVLYWKTNNVITVFLCGFIVFFLYQFIEVPNVLLSYANVVNPISMLLAMAFSTLLLILLFWAVSRRKFIRERELFK